MARENAGRNGGPGESVVYAMAGVADLFLNRVGGALQTMGAVLQRSDREELVGDGFNDLKARGELALKRHNPMPESHLETIARRVARRAGDSDA
jgi:hypothetical protein